VKTKYHDAKAKERFRKSQVLQSQHLAKNCLLRKMKGGQKVSGGVNRPEVSKIRWSLGSIRVNVGETTFSRNALALCNNGDAGKGKKYFVGRFVPRSSVGCGKGGGRSEPA